jgi:hypothetical protein
VVLLPYVTGGASGAGGGLAELGVIGGLVLAAVVKWGLKFAWRRLSELGEKRPGAHRAAR